MNARPSSCATAEPIAQFRRELVVPRLSHGHEVGEAVRDGLDVLVDPRVVGSAFVRRAELCLDEDDVIHELPDAESVLGQLGAWEHARKMKETSSTPK